MPNTLTRLKNLYKNAIDFVFPPLCLSCDAPIGEDGALCASCWKGIHFISLPVCVRCGMPFDIPFETPTTCLGCIANPPAFSAARAVMIYDDGCKHLILKFKYADRLHPAPSIARWMYRAGRDLCDEADLVVPVPLHRWRLLKRRYNQSALLARALSKVCGKKLCADALVRIRATPPQGGLNRKQRHKNVSGAIKINPKRMGAVDNKVIVLVDDVLTTGATVNECSKVLLAAGARKVYVLTIARTKLPSYG